MQRGSEIHSHASRGYRCRAMLQALERLVACSALVQQCLLRIDRHCRSNLFCWEKAFKAISSLKLSAVPGTVLAVRVHSAVCLLHASACFCVASSKTSTCSMTRSRHLHASQKNKKCRKSRKSRNLLYPRKICQVGVCTSMFMHSYI